MPKFGCVRKNPLGALLKELKPAKGLYPDASEAIERFQMNLEARRKLLADERKESKEA